MHPDELQRRVWLGWFKCWFKISADLGARGSGGHWPFTSQYNKEGIITPPKVMEAIEASGAKEVFLLFEFSHRERYPAEYQVIDDLKESVEYWRKYTEE